MAPQHMQYADAYHETTLAMRLQAVVQDCWGVARCELDRSLLERGTLQLTRLLAVLPDGVLLDLEEGSPEIPRSRPIAEHFPHTRESLPVFLGLPRERAGIDNYAVNAAAPTRFRMVSHPAYDLAGSDAQADVPLAHHSPQLVLGDEPREDMVALQILEIVRGPHGAFLVSEPYVPPCTRIDASPFLMSALRRLLQAMVTRQRALLAGRRERTGSSVEFRAEDVTGFLFLNTLNTFLPVLQHLVDTGDCSPRAAYVSLVQLAGQLSTFAVGVDPCSLPKFYYDDLRRTFEELFARLMSMLSVSMDERFVAMMLESNGTGMYRGTFESDASFFECTDFLLAVQTDMPAEQTSAQLPRLCKVASWQDIESILSAATPGARVQVTYRPPPEIPVKADTLYFTIETGGAFWRNIMADRRIAVYLPPLFDPPQTRIQLLGVKKGK